MEFDSGKEEALHGLEVLREDPEALREEALPVERPEGGHISIDNGEASEGSVIEVSPPPLRRTSRVLTKAPTRDATVATAAKAPAKAANTKVANTIKAKAANAIKAKRMVAAKAKSARSSTASKVAKRAPPPSTQRCQTTPPLAQSPRSPLPSPSTQAARRAAEKEAVKEATEAAKEAVKAAKEAAALEAAKEKFRFALKQHGEYDGVSIYNRSSVTSLFTLSWHEMEGFAEKESRAYADRHGHAQHLIRRSALITGMVNKTAKKEAFINKLDRHTWLNDVPQHVTYFAFDCGRKEVTVTVTHYYSKYRDGPHIVLPEVTAPVEASTPPTKAATAKRGRSTGVLDLTDLATRQTAASTLLVGFRCTLLGCLNVGQHCLVEGGKHHKLSRHEIFTWLDMIAVGTATVEEVPEAVRNRVIAASAAEEEARRPKKRAREVDLPLS